MPNCILVGKVKDNRGETIVLNESFDSKDNIDKEAQLALRKSGVAFNFLGCYVIIKTESEKLERVVNINDMWEYILEK